LVKVVDRGLDAIFTARRAQAGVDGALERAGPIRVLDQGAVLGYLALWQVDGGGRGPLGAVALGDLRDVIAERGVHREAAVGHLDSGAEYVLQLAGAEALQRGAPGSELRGDGRWQETVGWNQRDIALSEPVDSRRTRRPALAVDG